MKSKTTWILLAVLAAIAAYFFLVEEKQRAAREKERKSSRKLLQYGPAEVERVILINPYGDSIEMERSGSGWKITSPTTTDGAKPTIDLFLRQVAPGQILDELTSTENLSDFGLEKPYATVILFSSAGGRPDTIHIGDKTPTRSSCYVRLSGSKKVVITREITPSVVNKTLYHLRDKSFLHVDGGSIDTLMIRNGTTRIELKRETGNWWLDEPRVRADRTRIESYINMLSNAIIREFIREDTEALSQYGLENPEREIIMGRGSDLTKISFGDSVEGRVYVVKGGLDKVLSLKDELLKIFEFSIEDIRAMNLAFYDIDLVNGMLYETQDTNIVFEAMDDHWGITGEDTLIIEPYRVRYLLRVLAEKKFEKILEEPLPETGTRLDRFALRITLTERDGRIIDRITIAESVEGDEIGASISANAVGRLKKDTLSEVNRLFDQIVSIP